MTAFLYKVELFFKNKKILGTKGNIIFAVDIWTHKYSFWLCCGRTLILIEDFLNKTEAYFRYNVLINA